MCNTDIDADVESLLKSQIVVAAAENVGIFRRILVDDCAAVLHFRHAAAAEVTGNGDFTGTHKFTIQRDLAADFGFDIDLEILIASGEDF